MITITILVKIVMEFCCLVEDTDDHNDNDYNTGKNSDQTVVFG